MSTKLRPELSKKNPLPSQQTPILRALSFLPPVSRMERTSELYFQIEKSRIKQGDIFDRSSQTGGAYF